MKIHFLPTVWSDAILLEDGGHFALVDTGADYNAALIDEKLASLSAEKLDFIFITHFHPDHYGSLAHLVKKYTVDTVYFKKYSGLTNTDGNGNPCGDEFRQSETLVSDALFDECRKYANTQLTDGIETIDFNGTAIRVFYGDNLIKQAFEDTGSAHCGQYICNENQNSCMLYFEYGGKTVLLSGDVTDIDFDSGAIAMMNTRAARTIGRQIDVYKAPHHGYGVGSDEALEIYRPLYTFITNNSNFIKSDVIDRIKSYNPLSTVWLAGDDGEKIVEIDADGKICVR